MYGTFVIWSCGLGSLQVFFKHINSLRPTIKFIMEVETIQFRSWTCWSSGKDLHWTEKPTDNPQILAITFISNLIIHDM